MSNKLIVHELTGQSYSIKFTDDNTIQTLYTFISNNKNKSFGSFYINNGGKFLCDSEFWNQKIKDIIAKSYDKNFYLTEIYRSNERLSDFFLASKI